MLDANKMELESRATHAIVPALSFSSDPAQALAAHCNDPSVHEEESNEHDQEQLSGFIFMCNGRTKPQCYQYRVFGLPAGKMEVVEKIKRGMKLFLYDFELRLLYGIYEAASVGTLNLEQNAFNGRFPAQVGFKIYKDCLPLHESTFRHAIEHNCHKGFKSNQELKEQQVSSLLSLFRSLTVPALGSLQPTLHQAVQNQLGLPILKDSCAQILESQYVQKTGFQRHDRYKPQLGMGHVHPVMKPQLSLAPVDPITGMQLSYVQPVSELQSILRSAPSQQQQYFGSTTNMGHSNPTVMPQVLLTSNYQSHFVEVQQPYVVGNHTQPVPDQYNRTVCIDQLGTGNNYQLPLQGEGGAVQQQENSNPSLAAPHITPLVLSYMHANSGNT